MHLSGSRGEVYKTVHMPCFPQAFLRDCIRVRGLHVVLFGFPCATVTIPGVLLQIATRFGDVVITTNLDSEVHRIADGMQSTFGVFRGTRRRVLQGSGTVERGRVPERVVIKVWVHPRLRMQQPTARRTHQLIMREV